MVHVSWQVNPTQPSLSVKWNVVIIFSCWIIILI